MEIAACFSSSAGFAAKFGCLYDHIPLHAHTHINGYGSFLGFRGSSRGSRAVVAGGSASASAKKLAVNGYAGPSSTTSRLTYTWTDSCLVIPPPAGKKPRAIIKFLGGAFIGAVPELTYRFPKFFILCCFGFCNFLYLNLSPSSSCGLYVAAT